MKLSIACAECDYRLHLISRSEKCRWCIGRLIDESMVFIYNDHGEVSSMYAIEGLRKSLSHRDFTYLIDVKDLWGETHFDDGSWIMIPQFQPMSSILGEW